MKQLNIDLGALPAEIQTAIVYMAGSAIISTEDVPAQTEDFMQLINNYEYQIFQSGGRWYCKLPNGKRIARKRREDVEAVILQIQKDRQAEKDQKTKKTTWTAEQFFQDWQAYRKEKKLAKGNTCLRDQRTYDKYIGGAELAKRPIRETTRKEWTAYLQTVLDDNKPTAKAYAAIKGVVRAILDRAEDAGAIDYTAQDVISHIRTYRKSFTPPVQKTAAQETYTPHDLAKLKQYCFDHLTPYTRCILAGILIGTRPGECAPLHQDDVDIDARVIYIRQTETRDFDLESKKQIETVHSGAKTEAGVRKVVIPASAIDFFEDTINNAKQYSDVWLFPQEPGKWKTRYTGQRIRTAQLRRHLRDICAEIGIAYRPPHKLRKTNASILRANGVSDEVIISQLGHVDISITEDRYIYDRQAAAEKSAKLGEISELQLPPKKE